VQILATGFENDIHQVVLFGGALGDDDVALLMEHPRNSARFGHVSAVLAENMANLTYGAVAVVGVDVKQDCHSTRSVAFERKLFISRTGKFARAALDRAFDVVGGHVLCLGGHNGSAQARIRVRIASTLPRGNAAFLDKAGINLAPP